MCLHSTCRSIPFGRGRPGLYSIHSGIHTVHAGRVDASNTTVQGVTKWLVKQENRDITSCILVGVESWPTLHRCGSTHTNCYSEQWIQNLQLVCIQCLCAGFLWTWDSVYIPLPLNSHFNSRPHACNIYCRVGNDVCTSLYWPRLVHCATFLHQCRCAVWSIAEH
eukprot:scpid107003/ scgid22519/ 